MKFTKKQIKKYILEALESEEFSELAELGPGDAGEHPAVTPDLMALSKQLQSAGLSQDSYTAAVKTFPVIKNLLAKVDTPIEKSQMLAIFAQVLGIDVSQGGKDVSQYKTQSQRLTKKLSDV
tara:strand:+ start:1298 stop:1663 length:366 start_codon:yes stop_codon:yes gene_type:complete